MTGRTRAFAVVPLLGILAAGVACGGGSTASRGTPLAGLLRLTPGNCATAAAAGSWFRMVTPAGTPAKGPYVTNADSTCHDKTVTALRPGSDGGIRLGAYQQQPATPFRSGGNSAAVDVIAPTGFFGVEFGVSTNATDPQTRKHVPEPAIYRSGDTLTGDLSAWSVSWNGQQFNQGTPKPGTSGMRPVGSVDALTGVVTLEWTSRISGGPFNGFTGVWHLTGMFTSS